MEGTILADAVVSYAMLLAAIPALLVVVAGQWIVSRSRQLKKTQTWELILLVSAVILTLPFLPFAKNITTSRATIFLLLLLPALEGILAMLVINARQLHDLYLDKPAAVTLLIVALLLMLGSTALYNIQATAVLVLPALLLALVWSAGQRLGLGGMAAAGVLLSLFLLVDAIGMAGNHAVYQVQWMHAAYKITSGLSAILAIILAALCLERALKELPNGERRSRVIYLVLTVLLVLCVSAVTVRQGALVRATGRAPEDHLPFAVLAAGLIAGLLLVISANGRLRRAGIAYMLLVPAVIALSYTLGLQIDFQAVTDNRAAQIEQVLERYHQDSGEYPPTLSSLTPSYMLIILGPLTGRGQAWCYQAGSGYYRLGYVYFQRYYSYPDGTPFWEPYYEIKVPYSQGQPPSSEWMCDQELKNFKTNGGL